MSRQIQLDEFLWRSGLAQPGQHGEWTALTGGVSSDIWKVSVGQNVFCVKRALDKLKVAADWYASPRRNAYEWAWLTFAARHSSANVPTPLAHDPAAGVLAMSFLPPDEYPVWKSQLLQGEVSVAFAAEVGRLVGRLHSISTRDPSLRDQFGDTSSFEAIRLEPYLLETAARHPKLAPRLRVLVDRTKVTRLAAVHGDVSPKNILAGPTGPVFLDAEAAWYGDPAFDLAFCVNHLLLKCLMQPAHRAKLLDSFRALSAAYLAQVDWEPASALELRAATLLPALLLARVDGKSPVEYLTEGSAKQLIRHVASDWIDREVPDLNSLATDWADSVVLWMARANIIPNAIRRDME